MVFLLCIEIKQWSCQDSEVDWTHQNFPPILNVSPFHLCNKLLRILLHKTIHILYWNVHLSISLPYFLFHPSVLQCLLQFPRRNVEMLNFRTSFMGIRYRTKEITLQVKRWLQQLSFLSIKKGIWKRILHLLQVRSFQEEYIIYVNQYLNELDSAIA